jgi:hypothetical protein
MGNIAIMVATLMSAFASVHLLVLFHRANGEDLRARYGWFLQRWKLIAFIWVFLLVRLIISITLDW